MVLSLDRLKEDRQFGVDSRWSWVTAGFLSWVLFMTTMSQQCMGVLFYGLVHSYGINRGQAAWPLLFFGTSTSLAGVARSGNLVAIKVLASQHFEKLRAVAYSAIAFLAGLNMTLAPPLAEHFRTAYGIRGTFLLLGGLSLNACPAVIVLRSPLWLKSTRASEGEGKTKDVVSVNGESLPIPDDLYNENAEEAGDMANKLNRVALHEISLLQTTRRKSRVGLLARFKKLPGPKHGRQRTITPTARLFLTWTFALHALTFIVVIFGMATFLLLSVDIAKDRGVQPSSAVFQVTAFAAGDLTLTLLSGMVIDIGLLRLETVMFLGFFLEAVAFELFVWLRAFPMMLFCSVLIGASNGSIISLQAPALANDFGIEALPALVGGVFFCNGVALLTRPALVGYCRDVLGSYDLLLHLVFISSVVVCIAWVVKYIIGRRERQ